MERKDREGTSVLLRDVRADLIEGRGAANRKAEITCALENLLMNLKEK